MKKGTFIVVVMASFLLLGGLYALVTRIESKKANSNEVLSLKRGVPRVIDSVLVKGKATEDKHTVGNTDTITSEFRIEKKSETPLLDKGDVITHQIVDSVPGAKIKAELRLPKGTSYEFELKGIVYNTLRVDTIWRLRVDTLKIVTLQTDTLVIEKPGEFWKGVSIGATGIGVIGYIVYKILK